MCDDWPLQASYHVFWYFRTYQYIYYSHECDQNIDIINMPGMNINVVVVVVFVVVIVVVTAIEL